jgi:hypothetical protein
MTTGIDGLMRSEGGSGAAPGGTQASHGQRAEGRGHRTARRHRLVRQALVRRPSVRPAPGRRPLVSVIIPSYNYAAYLGGTVRSVLEQEAVDLQVIIVDDASADDSADVADRIAATDGRVLVIRHQRNAGHTAAFNTGYAAATGEFIIRLDSDDQLTPGSLARSAALFDAFPDVGLVYGHPVHFSGSVPETAREHVRSWSIWPGPDWIAERCRTGVNCITSQEAMVRASVMREVGPLSPEIKVATDLHLWLRIAAVSDVGRVDGCDQAFHRIHPASITGGAQYTQLVDLAERKSVFDHFLGGAGADLSRSAELAETVRARLAREALLQACRAYDRGRTAAVDVAAFTDFASGASPRARELRQWRALRRRQFLGARLAATPPFFTASAIARRIGHQARYRRWQRTGL